MKKIMNLSIDKMKNVLGGEDYEECNHVTGDKRGNCECVCRCTSSCRTDAKNCASIAAGNNRIQLSGAGSWYDKRDRSGSNF